MAAGCRVETTLAAYRPPKHRQEGKKHRTQKIRNEVKPIIIELGIITPPETPLRRFKEPLLS